MSAARRSGGFSLIELMIATAILGLVVVYLTQTFITSQRTYVVVDQVSQAQQNLRIIADLIERDLRLAGYMVPPHAAVCGVDATNAADVLYVSNADVILPVTGLEAAATANNDPTLLAGDFGAPITTALGAMPTGNGVALNLSRMWVDVNPGLGGPPDFAVNQGVIVVDRQDPSGFAVCGTITAVGASSITVNFDTGAAAGGVGTDLVAVPAHVYRVVVPGGGAAPQLFRDGMLLANDVDDLQLGLFFDLDDDGLIDAGEFRGDLGQAAGNGVPVPYVAPAVDGRMLRQVQLAVATMTRDADPDPLAPLHQTQITGNRNPATIAPADRRRRRVHNATVRLRNININS
jgi:prepilin-type N-terminal cleavage/methylation domain-containing protein